MTTPTTDIEQEIISVLKALVEVQTRLGSRLDNLDSSVSSISNGLLDITKTVLEHLKAQSELNDVVARRIEELAARK